MTSKERVKRAIQFQDPDRLPVVMFNRDFDEGDIIICDVIKHFEGENRDTSEYGFVWESFDGTMGQPRDSIIKDWDDFADYRFPDPKRPDRFEEAFEKERIDDQCRYLAEVF